MSIIVYKQRFAPPKDRATPIKNYLHIGYIAMRPRSMKNEDGIHGLFGYLSPSEPCGKIPWQETAKYVRQLSKNNVNIFRSIISFNRADADELGLISQKDWREYVKHHIRTLAEKNEISIENLGWCGAYHNEGNHPHLHIVFWDREQAITKDFVAWQICNDIRIALIKSTFELRIKELYEKKKLANDNITSGYDEAVSDFDTFMKDMKATDFKEIKSKFDTFADKGKMNITQLYNSDKQLSEVTEELFKLRYLIPKGGRIAYKLLPPEIKDSVDKLVDILIRNNTYLQTAVKQYIESQVNLKKLYNSLDDPEKLREYRAKCETEAKKQISYKIVKSIKAIVSKEYGVKEAEFTAARKQFYAIELMREILDFFARGYVANNSEGVEKENKTFGDLSERAIREWYLKNKDKGGMEF